MRERISRSRIYAEACEENKKVNLTNNRHHHLEQTALAIPPFFLALCRVFMLD
jgi:hypothetical protein